jgi:hypothetical protein
MKPEQVNLDDQIKKYYDSELEHSIYGTISTTTADGLWSQITADSKNVLEERMDKLELDNKLLRLKILGLEGKFTQEEICNIRKMLMSKDEASITVADSIIENA